MDAITFNPIFESLVKYSNVVIGLPTDIFTKVVAFIVMFGEELIQLEINPAIFTLI